VPDIVEATARAFLLRFGLDCGKCLLDIAPQIGLTIEEVDVQNFDGALLRAEGIPYGTIAINRNIRESGRKRFTIAHELGHYLMPNQQHQSDVCGKRDISHWGAHLPSTELDANRFAAEILMPSNVMASLLKAEPTFDIVRTIATEFGVTLTAAGYRLVELSSFRIAIVWSSERRSIWYKASPEFERPIQLGPLSEETYAFDAFNKAALPAGLEPVPATAWLYDVNLKDAAKVWEYSFPMAAYDGVLSFLYLKDPIEKQTDFSEPDEGALDPQDFTLARARWPKKH
jgi:IrrE N-terminal-like domain